METASHPNDSPPRRGRAGATFAIAGVATFMAALDNLVVTTALPSIQRDLGATLESLQWTVNAYTLTFAVLLMTAAILGDRYGRRRVFIAGITLFMVASALAALSSSEQMLVIARALQGAGGSVIFPLGLTLTINAVPAQRRGMAIAGLSATAGLGIAVGPLIGGLVLQAVDWQWIFWLNVPIGVVLIPFAMRLLAESHGPHTRLDLVGTLLVSGGLLGVVYPLVASSSSVDWSSPQLWGSLGAGLALLAAFVVWEHRTPWPVIPPSMFRSRGFALSSLNAMLIQGTMFGAVFLLVQYLQGVLAYPPADAGLRTLPWTIMPLFAAPVALMLASRLGVKAVMVISALIQGLALVWFALVVSTGTTYPVLLGAMVLAGFGMGLFFALTARQTLEFVTPEQEGVASGVNNAMRQAGVVFGIATLSSIFAGAGGRYGEPARFVDGLQSALWVGAAVLGVAVVSAVLVPARAPAAPDDAAERTGSDPLVPATDRSSSSSTAGETTWSAEESATDPDKETEPDKEPDKEMVPAPRTAFVTGATGLLGSNIVRELVAAGTEVLALVRDPGRAAGLLPSDGVRLVQGDVLDVDGIAPHLAGVDTVFHTAAYFREYYQLGVDLDRLHRTNVDAVQALLRAAEKAGAGVFVHTSSSGTLGPGSRNAPSAEGSSMPVTGTPNHYHQSKIRADAVVAAFEQTTDMRVATILPSWMWGPGDAGPTSSGRVFLAVASGAMPAIPKVENWVVDARDVASAAIHAARTGKGRYLVGGVRRSLPDIAREIAAAVPCAAPRAIPVGAALVASSLMEVGARLRGRTPVATRSGVRVLMDGQQRWITSERAQSELGVRFRDLDQTIRDVAGWYRDRGMLPS